MKKHFISKRIMIVMLCISVVICRNGLLAQTGTVKIFSELKPIDIYLDEKFQGRDIIQLDSVQIGSHYLKVIKDSVSIYTEWSQHAISSSLAQQKRKVEQ